MNKYLAQYVFQKNMWNRVFNKPEIDLTNISPAQARDLLDSLECDLSPENLCCDGELRGAALRNKAKMLNEAKQALLSGHY